jgi:hypothetical protein
MSVGIVISDEFREIFPEVLFRVADVPHWFDREVFDRNVIIEFRARAYTGRTENFREWSFHKFF